MHYSFLFDVSTFHADPQASFVKRNNCFTSTRETKSEYKVAYGDIDAKGRESNTAKEGERVAVTMVERKELVKVWNFGVIVVKEYTIFVFYFMLFIVQFHSCKYDMID